MKYISILLICFLTNSCVSQPKTKENVELESAKWYYYAYSIEQNGYSSSGDKLNPLSCGIKVNAIDAVSSDTVNFYFTLFYQDSSDVCYLKPLEIVGITQIKKSYYVPLYHSVIFDPESDSIIAKKMQLQSIRLMQKIYSDTAHVNSWLISAAKDR